MPQTEMTVFSVKGILVPAQASSCLELGVSHILNGKHANVPPHMIQVQRIPIAMWLHSVGTQGEVTPVEMFPSKQDGDDSQEPPNTYQYKEVCHG